MTTIEQRACELTRLFPFEVNDMVRDYGMACIREGLRVAIDVIKSNKKQLFAGKYFADAYLMGRERDLKAIQLILDGTAELPEVKE